MNITKNNFDRLIIIPLITLLLLPFSSYIQCADKGGADAGRTDFEAADYVFFRDPVLFGYKSSIYLTAPEPILAPEAQIPTIDLDEADDVDYAYFNDPFAFIKYRTDLPVQARFSGYVQYSAWWDSRQNVTFGDGYILLWPRIRSFDPDCRDINAQGQMNMISVETRFRCELLGPEVLKAKTSGYAECDVFGINFTSVAGIGIDRWRMRHAFLQMHWKKASLIMGQYWHPFFIPKTYSRTLAYAGGAPVQGYSFGPQLRIDAGDNKGTQISFIGIVELAFPSNGPIGVSTTYQRDARLPELAFLASHEADHHYGGFGLTFLRLKPRLVSNLGFKVNEYINSMGFCLFNNITYDPLEIRSNLIYMQNGSRLGMLGGYAVTELNPFTDKRTYTNLNSINFWLDININRLTEPGIFIGISKNLGARRPIIQRIFNPQTNTFDETIYAFNAPSDDDAHGDQIDTVIKVSPRIRFHVLPVSFAAEVEYCRTGYGCINNEGRVENIDPVANTRLLFSSYYFF